VNRVRWASASILLTCVFAQQPPQESEIVYRVGGSVSAPVAIFHPEPEYSEEARNLDYQGTVLCSAVVGSDGTVREIKILKPLGKGLDEKAIEVIRKWRFKPALKDGIPVAARVTIEVAFNLWGVPTHPEFIGDPPKCGSHFECVKVRLAVKKDGTVAERSIKVSGTKSKNIQQHVKRVVMQWRFKPAMQDGSPVRSEIEMDFDLDKLAIGAATQ
jgi:TonB family protein